MGAPISLVNKSCAREPREGTAGSRAPRCPSCARDPLRGPAVPPGGVARDLGARSGIAVAIIMGVSFAACPTKSAFPSGSHLKILHTPGLDAANSQLLVRASCSPSFGGRRSRFANSVSGCLGGLGQELPHPARAHAGALEPHAADGLVRQSAIVLNAFCPILPLTLVSPFRILSPWKPRHGSATTGKAVSDHP